MGHEYIKESDTFSTSHNGTVPKPTASDVSNNKILRADGSWVAQSGGGGGGSSTLAGLDDVLLTSIANGQILQWDADSQKFVNKGKVNSDSVKTPQDSNSGQRLASRYIGAAESSQATFQFVKFTGPWQDLTGIIIHRHGLTSISYGINGSYSVDTSDTSYISGRSSSHMPTASYDSSTHIISITLKSYEWAYFIGATHGQFL